MTPDNPSRSHLLEILRETNWVWSQTPCPMFLSVVAIALDGRMRPKWGHNYWHTQWNTIPKEQIRSLNEPLSLHQFMLVPRSGQVWELSRGVPETSQSGWGVKNLRWQNPNRRVETQSWCIAGASDQPQHSANNRFSYAAHCCSFPSRWSNIGAAVDWVWDSGSSALVWLFESTKGSWKEKAHKCLRWFWGTIWLIWFSSLNSTS